MLRGKYFLSNAPDSRPVLELRERIPEFTAGRDEFDDMALYALVYDEADAPAAAGRLYIDTESCFRIDYIGVVPQNRHKYMGDLVARMLWYKAQEMNAPRIVADVPEETVYFFARYGFRLISKEDCLCKMSVEIASLRLEGSCSKGDGGACKGDCENCV